MYNACIRRIHYKLWSRWVITHISITYILSIWCVEMLFMHGKCRCHRVGLRDDAVRVLFIEHGAVISSASHPTVNAATSTLCIAFFAVVSSASHPTVNSPTSTLCIVLFTVISSASHPIVNSPTNILHIVFICNNFFIFPSYRKFTYQYFIYCIIYSNFFSFPSYRKFTYQYFVYCIICSNFFSFSSYSKFTCQYFMYYIVSPVRIGHFPPTYSANTFDSMK